MDEELAGPARNGDELRRLPWQRLGAPELDDIRGRLSGEYAPATSIAPPR